MAVIEAGAVGCAMARESAGRGFRVLLVECGDIGAGISAWSSRLLLSRLGYPAVRYPLWRMPFRPADLLVPARYKPGAAPTGRAATADARAPDAA